MVVFKALSGPPSSTINALRWFRHITSFGNETAAFPAATLDATSLVAATAATAAPAAKAAAAPPARPAKKVVEEEEEEDEDDFDMFASDDEVDEEAEAEKQRRLAAYKEKKVNFLTHPWTTLSI